MVDKRVLEPVGPTLGEEHSITVPYNERWSNIQVTEAPNVLMDPEKYN